MVFTCELLSQVMTEKSSILWITIINFGYIEYTQNFLLSMKQANCQFKLVVFCLDKSTMDVLKSFDNCVCINADVLKTINPHFFLYTENFSMWGEKDYLEILPFKSWMKHAITNTEIAIATELNHQQNLVSPEINS